MSKIWFITGSSRGLGYATAEAALNSGASVIATARNPQTLDPLIQKFGTSKVHAVSLDVTDPASVKHAVENGVKKFGRIDVVVNNAGYANLVSIEDIESDDFRTQFETNFMGVVHVTKAVLPILRQQGSGHIFQISSLGGRMGIPGLGAYQSAKWAVGGFSTVLAQEVGPLGIKVTVMEPGGIKTDWAGSSMNIPPISEPYQQTVGAFETMLRQLSGNEPSLPEKIAQIMVDLSTKDDVPLRLLIGPDAVDYGAKAADAIAASDKKWHSVSISST